MKKSIKVEVMGRDYALRVEEEDEDHMRQVAQTVDGRMRAFQEAHPGQARLTAAVVTALAIAEELHILRNEKLQEDTSTTEVLDDLNAKLGEVLAVSEAESGT